MHPGCLLQSQMALEAMKKPEQMLSWMKKSC
jgi:hypothetical protein